MLPSQWIDSDGVLHSSADWYVALTLCGLPIITLVRGARGYICVMCAGVPQREEVHGG